MKRAVKYCGGCNPRYDRVALVQALEKAFGETLSPVRPGEQYDELYVVCGCTARCADLTGYRAERIVVLDSNKSELL